MLKDDLVIYSIEVRGVGVDRNTQDALKLVGIPSKYLGNKDISVPRLVTTWRGDDEEREWRRSLKAAIGDATIEATVELWTPLPGYPVETEGWDKVSTVLKTMI